MGLELILAAVWWVRCCLRKTIAGSFQGYPSSINHQPSLRVSHFDTCHNFLFNKNGEGFYLPVHKRKRASQNTTPLKSYNKGSEGSAGAIAGSSLSSWKHAVLPPSALKRHSA